MRGFIFGAKFFRKWLSSAHATIKDFLTDWEKKDVNYLFMHFKQTE